ncbi:hypothetical protein [Glycomyces paridis]|uniref:SMI1/KNR4 family protein n=1 Tax=Glycomyces paridis TaxID=2126555 RepID=A0A4S8PES0_9ACTN|nr:hypothetical protein [Glycomyces paridis]THV26824.1 hypothetical protein E9998_17720 [Glycomyces paridis]
MTALDDLARLANMTAHPSRHDWAGAEAVLGAPPPPDYVALLDAYGRGVFDRELVLFAPGCDTPGYDLLEGGLRIARDAEEFWAEELPGHAKPERLRAPGTRLIGWAGTGGAEYLYWVADARPSRDWTVAVQQAEDHIWEFHETGAVAFLHGLLSGAIETGVLRGFPQLAPHSYGR